MVSLTGFILKIDNFKLNNIFFYPKEGSNDGIKKYTINEEEQDFGTKQVIQLILGSILWIGGPVCLFAWLVS